MSAGGVPNAGQLDQIASRLKQIDQNAGVCGLESGSGLTGRGAHKFEGILP
jgi:hypothetical protein